MKRIIADPFPLAPRTDGGPSGWHAHLSLGFSNDHGTTRMMERTHAGPLRVQKALYPEGAGVCHAVILHPPGGVVGGDELAIRVRVGDDAAAFLTTPGAAKWYKANGRISRQDVHLAAGANASLEWLPQETIFFDAAQVDLDNTIELAHGATYIGGEILCFGRTASGESFATGRVRQRTRIRLDGKLLWLEQGALVAGSSAMCSALGLAGKAVCATLVAVGAAVPQAAVTAMRDEGAQIAGNSNAFGVTQIKSVLVARYLGNSSETARRLMIRTWQTVRPQLTGRAAVVPRIWNT